MFVQRRSSKKVNQGSAEQSRERNPKNKENPALSRHLRSSHTSPALLYSLHSHSKQVRKTKERLETALALPHTLPALQPRPGRFGWPAAATMKRACRPLIHTHTHSHAHNMSLRGNRRATDSRPSSAGTANGIQSISSAHTNQGL